MSNTWLTFIRFLHMHTLCCIFAALFPLFVGCNRPEPTAPNTVANLDTDSKANPAASSAAVVQPATTGTLFVKLPPDYTGIEFLNRIDKDHDYSRLYISGFASGGIAIGDVDGDELPDVYLTNGPGQNRLYRNMGNLRFEDITENSGVALDGIWSAGPAFADVDNDGDLDLHVCNYDSPNSLFMNDGHGVFTHATATGDAAITDASVMAQFCDYDGDGDLDYFLVTNRLYRKGGLPTGKITRDVDGEPRLLPEFQRYYHLVQVGPKQFTAKTSGRPNRLFENDGKGTFRDVSKRAGITAAGKGLSAVWYDYDLDGRMDIYVANDFDDPDHLYRNNGDGSFADVIQNVVPHTTWFSMGSDSADLNNDGMIDLMVLDMSATTHYRQKVTMGDMSARQHFMDHANPRQLMRNAVFLNPGVGRLMESAHMSGLASSDWSWAVKLADFDNDGWNDAFITNGMTSDLTNADKGLDQSKFVGQEEWQLVKDGPRQRDRNLAFRNRRQLKFESVADSWGLDHHGMSYSAAHGDLDGDGDLDLIVTNLDESVHVYRNDATSTGVTIALRGTNSNHFGIGAMVRISSGDGQQIQIVNPMTGFMSSNEPVVHFGTGDATSVESLTIDWPSGNTQTLRDVRTGMRHVITEDTESKTSRPEMSPLAFVFKGDLQSIRHAETLYDDFADQPLLPNKLSQLGPGIAISDVDGDGREDVYVGKAKGQAGSVFLREKLQLRSSALHDPDNVNSEDFAPLFFDADRDGDADLYVVSGGVEFAGNANLLTDRLYLNDGTGNFVKAGDHVLPETISFSGATVASADFDRDGDLDLFVGGRVVPGAYPMSPGSRLLSNESTKVGEAKFIDVTADVAVELQTSGMVTSAIWSDINSDGWIDLLVTTEWGPIRVFVNDNGILREASEQSGLANHLGWWNGIAGRDLDNDGDIDFVATNFGLNTKYHPTVEHPSRIYYGTFGDETKPHIVEAKVGDEEILPVRGKSCSQNAMPFVREKFGTYHDFAQASLGDIYSEMSLQRAELFEVNFLESAILLNDGTGKFAVKSLPTMAQISPGFGVITTELNGDGKADIYLVQNFYHPQRETGKMAGGMSILLYGNGDGNFEEVWPKQSGLAVAADAKGLATTDLNDDGWADLAITINNGPTLAFENRNGALSKNRSVCVRLSGPPGNPTCVGARVTVELSDGSAQTDEVRAGGSYLSQSTPCLFFGHARDTSIARIKIGWPDGTSSEYLPSADEAKIVVPWVNPRSR